MLKNIPPLLTPELLKILAEMGHGDEIVIGDANFAAASLGQRCVRQDGSGGVELLDAILRLLPLDAFVESPVTLMRADMLDSDPPIWREYREVIEKYEPNTHIEQIDRFAFYDRAKATYACVATTERALYACMILKKGVI